MDFCFNVYIVAFLFFGSAFLIVIMYFCVEDFFFFFFCDLHFRVTVVFQLPLAYNACAQGACTWTQT